MSKPVADRAEHCCRTGLGRPALQFVQYRTPGRFYYTLGAREQYTVDRAKDLGYHAGSFCRRHHSQLPPVPNLDKHRYRHHRLHIRRLL